MYEKVVVMVRRIVHVKPITKLTGRFVIATPKGESPLARLNCMKI